MKYNFLGNTGLVVSEICFGTMTFGGKGYWENIGKVQQKEVNELMKTVVDAGMFIRLASRRDCWGNRSKIWGWGVMIW
jgi:aryl-alcohol dehydrogenase-like predicted oxidoreductase